MAILALLAAALLVGACTPDGGARTEIGAGGEARSFTLAALNVEWLFDGRGDERFSNAPQSEAEAQAHLEDVASYLAVIDADYVSLAEVEDDTMLRRLGELLAETYAPIFVQGTDTYTGQDVGALSKVPESASGRSEERVRYPVMGSQLTCSRGDKGVSKHYWADIELLGVPVTVIGVHFLAYPDRCDRAVQREAQAAVIRNLVADRLAGQSGREVIVLGDFNDFDGEVADANGNRPISCVFDVLTDIDFSGAGDELINLAALIPAAERYTCWYDRDGDGVDDGGSEHSQLDTILISRGLLPYVDDVRIDHSYAAGSVSDHWPIIARFAPPGG